MRILLVDESPLGHARFSMFLGASRKVERAHHVSDARRLLAERQYDVVLAAGDLSVSSVVPFFGAAKEAHPEITTMFVSGNRETPLDAPLEGTVDVVLLAPLSVEDLESALDLVERHRTRRTCAHAARIAS